MLRYLTAGESHGPALVVTVEGMPAGLPILADDIAARARAPAPRLRARPAHAVRAGRDRAPRRHPPRAHARLTDRDRHPQQRVGDRQMGGRDVVRARRDQAATHAGAPRSRRPRGHAEVRLHRRARRPRTRQRARDRGAGRGGRARQGVALAHRRVGVEPRRAARRSRRVAGSPARPRRPRADRHLRGPLLRPRRRSRR